MKLTRKILIEKYKTSLSVDGLHISDYAMKKIYKELFYKNTNEICECIANKILSPMLNNNTNYIVGKQLYYDSFSKTISPVRKVKFYNEIICEFNIRLDFMEMCIGDYYRLESFIYSIWFNRIRQI